MEISAQIVEGINYKPFLKCTLEESPFAEFDINSAKSASLISIGQSRFGLSKWVSPKRTRSYPYERVYNTFSISKRITVIPVVKDEGASGDRDFLQWDTISLMSLLKMMLYSNLENGSIDNKSFVSLPVLQLTSEKIQGGIASDSESGMHDDFFRINNFNRRQKDFTQSLFVEARENNFRVVLGQI
jgi:hypothetical protein